ncbi:MAG: UMP kinase [Promethearchaeota archaeon]
MEEKFTVVKIGGSLLFREGTLKEDLVWAFSEFLAHTPSIKILVVGGGLPARWFIRAARGWGASEAECDLLGIYQSRLNARLLISALRARGCPVYPEPPASIEELARAMLIGERIVMGGLQPGQSTTSVALEVTEFAQAGQLWILTDVDGIYDKDPNSHPEAKKYSTISIEELEKIVDAGSSKAGEYRIFDAVSLQVLKRSSLEVRVLPGSDFAQLSKLAGDPAFPLGTRIQKDKK